MAKSKDKVAISTKEDPPSVAMGAAATGSQMTRHTLHSRYGYFLGPDAGNLQKFELAMRTDPIIFRALHHVMLSMLASLGPYVHPDKRAQEYVQELMYRMDGNLHEELGQLIFSSLWAGFGVSEAVYYAEGGRIWLRRMANYHPRSIHIVPDDQGLLAENIKCNTHQTIKKSGIWQEMPPEHAMKRKRGRRRDTYMNFVRLPMKKLVFVTHNKRHGNHAGESALAPIWVRYQSAVETLVNLMITTERYGSPQVAVIVPSGITQEQVSNGNGGLRYKTIAEKATETLARLSSSSGMVFEEPLGLQTHEKVRVQTVSSFNNFGESFLAVKNDLYADILVGLGLPPLLFLEHSAGLGGGSIAQVHAETYKQFITALYKEFVEPFVEQVIGRLLKWNFGISNPGMFSFNPFDVAATDTLMKTFAMAVDAGVLDTTIEEDLQLARTRLGLPMASQATIAERLKNNKALLGIRTSPDKDKVRIARERNSTTETVADLNAQTQQAITDKQTRTQLKLGRLNAETKANAPKPAPPKR